MLEKDLLQTRGFHNIIQNNEAAGFQFCVRLTYYRGIFLSQLRPQKIIVDGEVFPKEEVIWSIKNQDYTYGEMKLAGDVHWCPAETAVLKVFKKGGLRPGYHEICTGYKYSSSYMPPSLQEGIDREETNPFLEGMFGQLHSRRNLLLVW